MTPARLANMQDATVESIRAAGDALMSYSGLRYEGRYINALDRKGIHVLEFGDGPPVVLLHGAGAGGAIWHRQIAALSATRKVIVPEIPVFGLSDLPTDVPPIRTGVGELVNAILDAMGVERADIGGMSLGGLEAMGAVLHSPDRFDKLALVSSAGLGSDLPYIYRLARIPILKRLLAKPTRMMSDGFFNRMEAQMSEDSPERNAFMDYQFQVSQRANRGNIILEGITRFSSWRGQYDIVPDPDLARIRAKTLVIWGSHDRFFPLTHATRAATVIPNAHLEVIQNCGHLTAVDAPEELTAALVRWFGGG